MDDTLPTLLSVDSEDVFHTPTQQGNVFTRLLTSLKVALMGTLFIMAKDMSFSFKVNLVAMTIDCLQTLSFPFNLESEFPWNEEYSHWFAEFVIGSKVEFYLSHEDQRRNIIIYSVSVTFVFLNLVNAAVIGYRFFTNKVQNVCLLKALRSIASLLASILYLPLLGQFSIILSCSLGLMHHQGCPVGALFTVTAALISVVFTAVALVVVASFYEQDCNSEDAAARPHARVELIYLVVKCTFTVEFALLYTPEYRVIQLTSLLVLSGLTAFLYCYFLPFYHFKTTCIQAGLSCVLFWASLCLLLAVLQSNHEDAGPITLFYLGSVSAWLLGKGLCEWRFAALEKATAYSVNNVYEVELATRFRLIKGLGSLKVQKIKANGQFGRIVEEIEEFYYAAERRFPKSSILQVFFAQFYLTFKSSPSEALVKLSKASQFRPGLDEQFIIYKRQQCEEEANSDAIAFVTFNTHLQVAHRAETEAMRTQVRFWGELQSSHKPDFVELIGLAKYISENIDTAAVHYSKLMTMNSNHSKLLRMYAYFLEDVTNELDASKELLNRAENLEMSREKDALREVFRTKIGAGIFRLSAENRSFGLIEKVNKRGLALLQTAKSSVINQPLAAFLPPQFQALVTSQLREYVLAATEDPGKRLETGLFLLDRQGFLVYGQAAVYLDSPGSRPASSVCSTPRSSAPDPFLAERQTGKQLLGVGEKGSEGNISSRGPEDSLSSRRSSIVDTLYKLVLEVTVAEPEPSIVLMDSLGAILHLTPSAGSLLGLAVRTDDVHSLADFIFLFANYLEDSIARAAGLEGNGFASVPTFLVSSTGHLTRIRLHFTHFSVEKELIWAVQFDVLTEFNKKTMRFFAIFAHFMKRYFSLGLRNGFAALENTNIAHLLQEDLKTGDGNKEQEEKLRAFFKRMRLKISKSNAEGSPELLRLKWVTLLLLLLLYGLYVGSFIASHFVYSDFLAQLEALTALNSLKHQSLAVTALVGLLDLSGQGAGLGWQSSELLQTLNHTTTALQRDVESFRLHFNEKVLGETIEVVESVQTRSMSAEDALLTQAAYATSLLASASLSSFSISASPQACWLYENGGNAIAQLLEDMAEDCTEDAKSGLTAVLSYLFAFVSGELLCLLIAFFSLFPLLLKSESLQYDVISVFYSLPLAVVSYLLSTSRSIFHLMEQSSYPEGRSQAYSLLNEEELARIRTLAGDSAHIRDFAQSRAQLLAEQKTLKRQFLALFRTQLIRKFAFYVLFLAGYILSIQLYVGGLWKAGEISSAADIVHSAGMLETLMHQSSLSLLSIVLSSGTEDVFPSANRSHDRLQANSQRLLSYMSLFRAGNSSLGVHYDSIYTTQISHFYPSFFGQACSLAGCEQFYSGLLREGLYSAVARFCGDIQDLGWRLKNLRTASPKTKTAAFEQELALIVDAELKFLSSACREVEKVVLNYYKSVLSGFQTGRIVALAVFLAIGLLHYVFGLSRDVRETEKRKRLTRSMLIMLPFGVVRKAQSLQEAIQSLSYD